MMKKIFALGFFDGVHIGHQALLAECCRMAKEQNKVIPSRCGNSHFVGGGALDAPQNMQEIATGALHPRNDTVIPAAVTFDLPPAAVLAGKEPNMLTSLQDRIDLLTGYGMQEVKILDTKTPVLSQKWEEFLNNLVAEGAVGFICGEDFRFGHKGEGTAEILRAYCREKGLVCSVVPKEMVDGIPVSSTKIRQLIAEGQMEQAVKFLGHPHILTAEVVKGRQIGRTMDFPTANLLFPDGVLVPRFGVYACKVAFDGKIYDAVTNVGVRPTVNGQNVTAEAHLLDFSGDLYGKKIRLEFYKFLRPEQKFADLNALKAQIAIDIAEVQKPSPGGKAFACGKLKKF